MYYPRKLSSLGLFIQILILFAKKYNINKVNIINLSDNNKRLNY